MRKIATIALLVPCLGMVSAGFAEEAIIDLSGHSWETGGFPPSNGGDVFAAVGIVNDVSAPLSWNPFVYSYTWYMRDLVSVGEVVFGDLRLVSYSGGYFTVYRDALPSNHDYGTFPANATSPSTFSDGVAYLDGFFLDFSLSYNNTTLSGSFSGTLNFTGGLVYPNLSATDGWTLGSDLGGTSPDGYDLNLNGEVYMQVIQVEDASWGAIKSLYR